MSWMNGTRHSRSRALHMGGYRLFGMVKFGLGRGQGGLEGPGPSQAILVSGDTHGLLDRHTWKAHQGACSLVA